MNSLRPLAEGVLSVLLMTDGEDAPLTRVFRSALAAEQPEALEQALEHWLAERDEAIERRLAQVASLNAAGILRSFALTRASAVAVLELATSPDFMRLVAVSRRTAELPLDLTPLERARAVQAFSEALEALNQDSRRARLQLRAPPAPPAH